jgi:hypothetical protein
MELLACWLFTDLSVGAGVGGSLRDKWNIHTHTPTLYTNENILDTPSKCIWLFVSSFSNIQNFWLIHSLLPLCCLIKVSAVRHVSRCLDRRWRLSRSAYTHKCDYCFVWNVYVTEFYVKDIVKKLIQMMQWQIVLLFHNKRKYRGMYRYFLSATTIR